MVISGWVIAVLPNPSCRRRGGICSVRTCTSFAWSLTRRRLPALVFGTNHFFIFDRYPGSQADSFFVVVSSRPTLSSSRRSTPTCRSLCARAPRSRRACMLALVRAAFCLHSIMYLYRISLNPHRFWPRGSRRCEQHDRGAGDECGGEACYGEVVVNISSFVYALHN